MWWMGRVPERFAKGAGEDGEWDYGCGFRVSGTRVIELGADIGEVVA